MRWTFLQNIGSRVMKKICALLIPKKQISHVFDEAPKKPAVKKPTVKKATTRTVKKPK